MTSRAAPLVAAAALALAAAAALANDFWLAPSTFRPEPGAEVSVRLMVGAALQGRSRGRDDARIDTFVARGPDGEEEPLAGKKDDDPAGRVRVGVDPGLWVVGFRSKPASVALDAAKFEEYLRAQGLEHVVEQRAALGEKDAKGRELYVRCAKALLSVGKGQKDGQDRALGFPLELFPDRNPYRAAAGDEIGFRLVRGGTPVEGVLVRARAAAQPDPPLEARTDADGRVRFRLDRAGVWFVGGVHMVRSDAARTFADWESWWASVTFELPERPAVVPPPK